MADQRAILTAFRAQIESVTELAVVQWDNQPFTSTDGTPWGRFTVLFNQTFLAAMNEHRYRHSGLATLQIFVPFNTGNDAAWAEAETVILAFRALTFSEVVVRTPWAETIGRDRDGKWWQVNVNIPFYSDKT